EIEDLGWACIREILCRRPHELASCDRLQRGDGGAEPAAAEEEAGVADADAALDGQHPAMGIVGRLEAEELTRRHRLRGCEAFRCRRQTKGSRAGVTPHLDGSSRVAALAARDSPHWAAASRSEVAPR